jgi:hypothetical protein
MCLMLMLLTQMVFFLEIHIFLELRWICIFGAKRGYLLHENYDLQDVFISKIKSFFTGNPCARCCTFYYRRYFGEIPVFLPLSWIALLEANRAHSTLKLLTIRKYPFQKLTQFSYRNNMEVAPASKWDGILYRHVYVSSTRLNRPIWNNGDILNL